MENAGQWQHVKHSVKVVTYYPQSDWMFKVLTEYSLLFIYIRFPFAIIIDACVVKFKPMYNPEHINICL